MNKAELEKQLDERWAIFKEEVMELLEESSDDIIYEGTEFSTGHVSEGSKVYVLEGEHKGRVMTVTEVVDSGDGYVFDVEEIPVSSLEWALSEYEVVVLPKGAVGLVASTEESATPGSKILVTGACGTQFGEEYENGDILEVTGVSSPHKGVTCGKYDALLYGEFKVILFEDSPEEVLPKKTPNQLRAKNIRLAKEFIGDLQREAKGDITRLGNDTFTNISTYVDFLTDSTNRTVRAAAVGSITGNEYGMVEITCEDDKVFNEYIAKAIAIGELYGVFTPELNSIESQPTEPVVGMFAEIQGNAHPYTDTIVDGYGYLHGISSLTRNPDNLLKIIDDTKAKYEEVHVF